MSVISEYIVTGFNQNTVSWEAPQDCVVNIYATTNTNNGTITINNLTLTIPLDAMVAMTGEVLKRGQIVKILGSSSGGSGTPAHTSPTQARIAGFTV